MPDFLRSVRLRIPPLAQFRDGAQLREPSEHAAQQELRPPGIAKGYLEALVFLTSQSVIVSR